MILVLIAALFLAASFFIEAREQRKEIARLTRALTYANEDAESWENLYRAEVRERKAITGWADREDARKARSVANKALLSRVTDEDRVEIAALIRNTGCRVGEWAA